MTKTCFIKANASNEFFNIFKQYLNQNLGDKKIQEVLDKLNKKKSILYSFITNLKIEEREEVIRTVIRANGYLNDLKRIKYVNDKILYPQTIKQYIDNRKNELKIDSYLLTEKVYQRLGLKNDWVDVIQMIIDISDSYSGHHLDYNKFCVILTVKQIHDQTDSDYMKVIHQLYDNTFNGEHKPMIDQQFYNFAIKNINKINEALDYDRDSLFDYMGLKTLIKSYMKHNHDNKMIERPQHMWMRVALGIHMEDNDINLAIEAYHDMSQHFYTHASPTLYNIGTDHPQNASCFLLGGGINNRKEPETFKEKILDIFYKTGEYMSNLSLFWSVLLMIPAFINPWISLCLVIFSIKTIIYFRNENMKYYDEDSMESIGELWKRCANISKYSGGIGLSMHNIRAQGQYIAGTQGKASGLKMCHVLDEVCVFADQGGGKRPGAFAIYLETWHADIEYLLDLKKPTNQNAARNLFYAMWVSDLFMKRVQNNEIWSLMCPKQCSGLDEVYGEDFEKLYTSYEKEGKFIKQIPAKKLWDHIIEIQQASGTPYILYKDHINRKNNQKNLGTIKCSNLCAEIVEYSNPNEIAVCNLASISLPKFVDVNTKTIDLVAISKIAYKIAINLNKLINTNFYPLPQMKRSNFRHRPIGIGIQGLHNAFMMMKLPFDSEEAINLDRDIMEAIYYGALKASTDLARKYGHYDSFRGSPISQGKFQFDLWNEKPSDKWDWETLRESIKIYGLRNSLMTTCMPTASTSRFFGNVECFEPIMSNIFSHETKAGNFQVYNKHLMEDMIIKGLWDEQMREELYKNEGSVQNCSRISDEDKALYKTAWEIPMKCIIDHARARAPFVDQTMSMNLFLKVPNSKKQTKALFYAWEQGLKTGQYYFRTQPRSQGENYAVQNTDGPACSRDNPDCTSCSG
jgi:ribonucleoside-diphosphate reductase subunit M1